MSKDYDFAGWVTKNDIHVSDGTIIRKDAFSENNGGQVPLVWNHRHDDPSNVIGKMRLVNRPSGVYGYGTFNTTPQARDAKTSLVHGDINAMSIGANRIKRDGPSIVHGNIFEVSLVLAGANPGATIEEVVSHGDGEDNNTYITTDEILHSAESELDDEMVSNEAEVLIRGTVNKQKILRSL